MGKIKKMPIIVTTTLAMLSTTILAASGIVNAPSGLVLRDEASKAGSPITTVGNDAKVEIIEKDGEWYKVKYNGQEGYLFAEYVEVEETIEEEPQTEEGIEQDNEQDTQQNTQTNMNTGIENIQVKSEAKLYMMPLITSTPINTIAAGTGITIEKEITNWSYVSDGTNEGWIRTYLIQNEQAPQVENPDEEITEQPQQPEESEQTQQPEEQEESKQPEELENPPVDNTEENPVTATKGDVNVDFANVRKEASQESEILTTLTRGTGVTINSETTEWYKITYTGLDGTVYEGYIFKNLVAVE